ncbi:uncharacterized protein LOC109834907 [Asparagus officinalis]|uniref:uncharacterized protein LOC109834907 n=1 Tax=Asparagus officinalis TaxID=4686 RepID=UPI00098E2C14|nr:uncharacterized protein LOC109834907 [Asparagus officinalis]
MLRSSWSYKGSVLEAKVPKELAPKIVSNHLYYPYFKDCIGMIDGTYIDVFLPARLVARFRGRKGVTQNVLAACTPILACAILHNYIAIVDPGDDLLNEDITIDDDDGGIATKGEDDNVANFSQNVTQREERDSMNEWKEKRDDIASAVWVDYCNKYHGGDTTEIGL